ncbi:MAG TPA: acyl carrier protein [Candidatus Solibacter sp.]|jgi:acyl carrier protein|nr:acyl carrier protein [Candidatus Solibacter sp.]
MREEITALLKSEVARMVEAPLASIDDSAHLADLGMDSLQALQLLVLIERTYDLQIGEEELQQFTSIAAVTDLVMSYLSMAKAS